MTLCSSLKSFVSHGVAYYYFWFSNCRKNCTGKRSRKRGNLGTEEEEESLYDSSCSRSKDLVNEVIRKASLVGEYRKGDTRHRYMNGRGPVFEFR